MRQLAEDKKNASYKIVEVIGVLLVTLQLEFIANSDESIYQMCPSTELRPN